MITAEEMEEFRRDMLDDDRRDELLEKAMRVDDIIFSEHMYNKYGDIMQEFVDECALYGREDCVYDWFVDMLEK